MAYRVIDPKTYYRKDAYRRFTEDCKCSVSMTARLDVTDLRAYSDETGTKFYLNFLYLLSKVMNARDDYKMDYFYKTNELVCCDVIHPTHYAFHPETETCTPVYSTYYEDYETFYQNAEEDLARAKRSQEYVPESTQAENRFDASYIPWYSYDAMHLELPDGYLYFAPIINWGRYRVENGRLMMPLTVRMNHAVADGYTIARVFGLLETEMEWFVNGRNKKNEP